MACLGKVAAEQARMLVEFTVLMQDQGGKQVFVLAFCQKQMPGSKGNEENDQQKESKHCVFPAIFSKL